MDDFDALPKMAGWHETKLSAPIEHMTPTNKLRFVEREISVTQIITHKKVLQQWWEDRRHDIHWTNGAPGEWRDIPLEQEST